MAPVIKALEGSPRFNSLVCATGQHRGMLDQLLAELDVSPDYDLDIMKPGQDLAWITTSVLSGLTGLVRDVRPDWLLVHGDTTSAMAAAMAGFYAGVKVAHVEAGLRTWDLRRPWPEEFNRSVIAKCAQLHFAPTSGAQENLLRDNVTSGEIHVTGNTVVDAVMLMRDRLQHEAGLRERVAAELPRLDPSRRLILVTAHRRENFGRPFEEMCEALARIAERNDVELVYPVHPNPAVQEPVHRILGGRPNIHLTRPLSYAEFVYLLMHCTLVVTDSGGVQEEAPSLGKPVLVTRDVTERPEAVAAGTVVLVGTDRARIVREVDLLLDSPQRYAQFARAHNPYGDGKAAQRIASLLDGVPLRAGGRRVELLPLPGDARMALAAN